jgi:peptidoglycan/LPS O-acetylase OafA/YrhL
MPDKTIPTRHLGYLDSARGIAALMVMVYHYVFLKYGDRLAGKLTCIVFNGSDAVSFFFVLSGFVLSYKYIVLNQSLDIKKFYVNRLFRLWPAYFITVLINALNTYSSDFNLHNFLSVFSLHSSYFWEEAFIFRGNAHYYVPGWTLVLELSFSFLMPFAVALAKKDIRILYWMLFAYIVVGSSLRDLYFFHVHFTLGLLISCFFYKINDASFKETKWYKWRYPLLFGALILFSIRQIDSIIPFGPDYIYFAKYLGIDFFLYTGIASFVFIVAMVRSEKFKKFFEHSVLRFFGKISYGIYLMHWLLVVDVYRYWDKIRSFFPSERYTFIVVFFVYSAATILLSIILHYGVERPFIRMGRRLTNRMKPSLQIN